MHERAFASANVDLGPATCVGELRARGMGWLLVLAGAIAWFLFWFFGPLWYIPLTLVIVALVATIVWMHRVSGVYSIHRDGLAISRGWTSLPWFGARLELYRWDEIAAVYRRLRAYYSIPRYSRVNKRPGLPDETEARLINILSRYEIVTRDGRRAVFDASFGDADQVGGIILREVSRQLLPDLLARYDRGEPVAFGPLTLRQHGLVFGPHSRPWSEVGAICAHKGFLEVTHPRGLDPEKWRTPLRTIPNADLLFALLAQRQPDLWVVDSPDHLPEFKYFRRRYNRL